LIDEQREKEERDKSPYSSQQQCEMESNGRERERNRKPAAKHTKEKEKREREKGPTVKINNRPLSLAHYLTHSVALYVRAAVLPTLHKQTLLIVAAAAAGSI